VALIRATIALDSLTLSPEEQVGVEVVRRAAFVPAIVIATNCGKNGSSIAEKIGERQGSWGYNGMTDTFADLVKEGIVDPLLVTKQALLQAASIAGMLLTSAALVSDRQ
jgi:chaperonin GroEL